MSRGTALARLGFTAAMDHSRSQQYRWNYRRDKCERAVHAEAAEHAHRAWVHTGEVALQALTYLNAATDRFAVQAAREAVRRTGLALGEVEAVARAVSHAPNDPVLAKALAGAEEAVALAEDIQDYVLSRVPVHELEGT